MKKQERLLRKQLKIPGDIFCLSTRSYATSLKVAAKMNDEKMGSVKARIHKAI